VSASGSDGEVPVDELSFVDARQELDEIVEFFEQREMDIDQLVSRLERATAIVAELDRRLRHTQAQVEELVPRLEAAAAGETLAGPEEGDDDVEAGDRATDAPEPTRPQGLF
jgi:exodeoxyribonuclease VII small subunit